MSIQTADCPARTDRGPLAIAVQLARIALLAAFVVASPAAALQAPADASPAGRITGRVVDAATGTGLSDVGIQVVGTTSGTQSGVDGRFTLNNVRAGTVTLHVRRLGFEAKTITGLMVNAGQTVVQDIAMQAATVQLTAQVVTAFAERGSVSAALDAQRNAMGVVNAVTAEQIAKSPDSDAAQAVQRVSGVTVQDGKYVLVRGLGERYTSTSLNGARIPSAEPERKVVALDLFPSSLLQSITTSKNFTPDQPGDFSGAMVNLRTREFPAERQVSYSLSLGANQAITGRPLLQGHSDALTYFGFAGGGRRLPAPVLAAGEFEPTPNRAEMHRLVGSFNNRWTPVRASAAPNAGMGVTYGGTTQLGEREVGYVGSLTYSHASEARVDETRAYYDPTGGGTEIDRFTGSTGRTSVLWGGLANLSTMLGSRSRISFNNTYNRGADNEARSESGYSQNLGQRLLIDRLRLVERQVYSSQLAGEHQVTPAERLDWALTLSGVTRNEPDRSEFGRLDDGSGQPFWADGSEMAVRTFGALTERSVNLSTDYTRHLGDTQRSLVKAGLLGRYTMRDARNQVFSLQAFDLGLDARRAPAEQIFADVEGGSATFRIAPLSQGGSYEAQEGLGAGYAMSKLALRDDLDLVGGARVEVNRMEVIAEPTVGLPVLTRPTYVDVLPSLALNYRMTDAQNLRVSATQTLARPEYRELAEVQYRDVIGGENVLGNPNLERTLIRNADVRWEWYPEIEEVFTVGVFAKQFHKPIERLYLATSGTRMITYENAESATNLGVELEARAGLGRLADALRTVTLFSNATVMRSEIRTGDGVRANSERRSMVGQAPYVVNAGATYASGSGLLSGTVLFNQVGRRINAAGEQGLPSVYEESRSVLDVSLRFPGPGDLTGKLDLKNLLDAPYLLTQGQVTRERYRAGRTLSVGFTWQR